MKPKIESIYHELVKMEKPNLADADILAEFPLTYPSKGIEKSGLRLGHGRIRPQKENIEIELKNDPHSQIMKNKI